MRKIFHSVTCFRPNCDCPTKDTERLHAMEVRLLEWAAQLEASSGVGPFIGKELRNRMAGA